MRKRLVIFCVDLFHPVSLAIWMVLLNVKKYASLYWGKGFILLAHCSNVVIYCLLPVLFTSLCLKVFHDYSCSLKKTRFHFFALHLLLVTLSEIVLEGATKGKAFYIAPFLFCYTSAGLFLLLYMLIKAINNGTINNGRENTL